VDFKKARFLSKIKRLTKTISVFEVLVGFLILAVLGLVVLQIRSKEEWVKAEVKVSSESWFWKREAPPYWLGESIKVGDCEHSSSGKKIAEVLQVKEYELATLAQQEKAKKDFYLTLKLKISKDRRTAKIKFKNQPLEVGGPIELHLTNTYIPGLVTFIEGARDGKCEKEVLIDGVWLNNYPWNAEAIPVGGKMEDGMGNVVAEILEKRIELAEKTVETDWGGLVVNRDPLKRDIHLRVRLRVREAGGNLYFLYDKKVKVGEDLFIQLPGVDVKWLAIRKIYDGGGKRLY